MLELNDKDLVFQIVAATIAEAHLTCASEDRRNRWVNAIAKATTVLEGDLTFFHWDPFEASLYFWSADSGEIYRITNDCQCPAFLRPVPLPCYHRAMHRIVSRYFGDSSGGPAQIDFADAVFFDAEMNAGQKIELLRDAILDGRADLKPRVAALEAYIASTTARAAPARAR